MEESTLMPTAVFARWSLILPELEPAAIPSLSLPAQVGAWRSTQEEQLSDEVWAVIEPDAHVVRRYEAPGRSPIWLYLGLYVGRWGDKNFAHDPKVCYPAQGWEIIATEQRRLALKNSESLKATFLEVQNGLREEAVVYWFQPARRWPGGSAVEQLMRVYDAVTGRPNSVLNPAARYCHLAAPPLKPGRYCTMTPE